ncbi:MAG: hypothetical protein AB1742_14125, partial [bacterium]
RQAVGTLGAYFYHFWMKDMKPIRKGSGDQYMHRESDDYRAAVCRARGVSTTQYYNWRDELFKSAGAVYGRRKNERQSRGNEALRAEIARKDAWSPRSRRRALSHTQRHK